MAPFRSRCRGCCVATGVTILLSANATLMALAFSTQHRHVREIHDRAFPLHASYHPTFVTTRMSPPLFMSTSSNVKFEKVDEDDDQVIAFMDASGERGIDCYVDSYATVDGVEYTIGSPCDYAVALCYFEGEDEQLVPIELDDPLMDDIFPIAESIIEDEFGEELVLLRTPQTLTLVGVSFSFWGPIFIVCCFVLYLSSLFLNELQAAMFTNHFLLH